jgi:hypothetical protein
LELRPRLVDYTPLLDTSIYASADVLSATAVVANLCRDKNRATELNSLIVVDADDQKAAFDIYFLSADGSFAAVNLAAAPADAVGLNYLGHIAVAAADYRDLGGVAVATYRDLSLILKPATDTSDIYVALVNGAGTPTYSASGLKLRFGVRD